MLSTYFIKRPILACVVALLMMLAGLLALPKLPLAQFPQIAAPTISVSARYPGASAQTVEDAVVQIIEQRMQNLENLQYISASSNNNGQGRVELTFKVGTSADDAQIKVQNALQTAMSRLPQEVQRQGVTVNKSSRNFLQVWAFISSDGGMTRSEIADYLNSYVIDQISRVEGVGEVQVFGSGYAMRVWLKPEKLQAFALVPQDIITAIQQQNTNVSAGQLGALPQPAQQQLNFSVAANGRFTDKTQFENVVLKTTPEGGVLRLKDVATVELGNENYETLALYNGMPAAGMGVRLAAGANALDVAERLQTTLTQLQPSFPHGLTAQIANDSIPFIKLSIKGVLKTLIEAIVLVFLVMWLFLQNWRATLIPTLAIPIVVLGVLAVLYVLGYSINTLTLFALVLAIGLLVDDAIVVVENVERIMHEQHVSALHATQQSMQQITPALVGITMVLSAVFVPMAFFTGATGVIYRQFSVTLVSAMVLSVIVAIVFTPALTAYLLKPHSTQQKNSLIARSFARFNHFFARLTTRSTQGVAYVIRRKFAFVVVYGVLVLLTVLGLQRLPTAFFPKEDQGIMYANVQLPAGSTQARTIHVLDSLKDYFLTQEKQSVQSVFLIAGSSGSGGGQNAGRLFIRLKPWHLRLSPNQHVEAIKSRADQFAKGRFDAKVNMTVPPPVTDLGQANGFELQLLDQAGVGRDALLEAANTLVDKASALQGLNGVRINNFNESVQYKLHMNYAQSSALGVSSQDANQVLATAWGGTYVNDFIDQGKVKRVYVQGDATSRSTPEDLGRWFVRNKTGQMVPLSSFTQTGWESAPSNLERFNGMASVAIQGSAAAGVSSGEAINMMEQLSTQLPQGIGMTWSGLSFEEKQATGQAGLLYAISAFVVFLALAALYESFAVPIAVMLVVPIGLLGAAWLTGLRGLENDIYFQVGLLTVMGLSAKNGILIVEFAEEKLREQTPLVDALLWAVKQRLRPILMTSLALCLGVLPLVFSHGAGSGAQHAVGTGVLGGVLSATVLGIFCVSLFYLVIRSVVPLRVTRQNTNSEVV